MDRCNGTCGCAGCDDCALVTAEIGSPVDCGECGHRVVPVLLEERAIQEARERQKEDGNMNVVERKAAEKSGGRKPRAKRSTATKAPAAAPKTDRTPAEMRAHLLATVTVSDAAWKAWRERNGLGDAVRNEGESRADFINRVLP